MELKSKVQTEDVGTRCRIRVHIHARTKSVEGKTVHFRVITAVVGKDEGILHTGEYSHVFHSDFGNQALGQNIAQCNV